MDMKMVIGYVDGKSIRKYILYANTPINIEINHRNLYRIDSKREKVWEKFHKKVKSLLDWK